MGRNTQQVAELAGIWFPDCLHHCLLTWPRYGPASYPVGIEDLSPGVGVWTSRFTAMEFWGLSPCPLYVFLGQDYVAPQACHPRAVACRELCPAMGWRPARLAGTDRCWRQALRTDPSSVPGCPQQTSLAPWRALSLPPQEPRRQLVRTLYRTATWDAALPHSPSAQPQSASEEIFTNNITISLPCICFSVGLQLTPLSTILETMIIR
jgi:hypothetical protein